MSRNFSKLKSQIKSQTGDIVLEELSATSADLRDLAKITAGESLRQLLIDATFHKGCAEAGLEALHRRNAIIRHRYDLLRKH